MARTALRRKPIESFWFALLAILFAEVFCLHLLSLLLLGWYLGSSGEPPYRFEIIDHDIEVFPFSTLAPGVRAEQATQAELDHYNPILFAELARYKEATIREIGLRRIVVCRGLTVKGHPVGGLTAWPGKTIVLDVEPPAPGWDEVLRRAIHHEILHIIDQDLEQRPGAAGAWARLNPEGFSYGGDEILWALERTKGAPVNDPRHPDSSITTRR